MNTTKKKQNDDPQIAYEAYSLTIDRLQHFNNMQMTYKTFALTWLAATFFGIGYSLSSQETNLPFHPLIIIALLCVASSTGIIVIWYMDLIMCERMIATALFEGLEYEEKYVWIPKIHKTSILFHGLWGYVHLKEIFYVGCFSILYGTMSVALGIYQENLKYRFIPLGCSILIVSIFVYASFSSIKKINPYARLSKLRKS